MERSRIRGRFVRAAGRNARLIRVECCNGTDTPRKSSAALYRPAQMTRALLPRVCADGRKLRLPEHAAFVLAKDYDDLRFAVSRPTTGWDGTHARRAEPVEGLRAIRLGLGFGCAAGYRPFGQPLPSGARRCNLYVHAGDSRCEALSVCAISTQAAQPRDLGFPRGDAGAAARLQPERAHFSLPGRGGRRARTF